MSLKFLLLIIFFIMVAIICVIIYLGITKNTIKSKRIIILSLASFLSFLFLLEIVLLTLLPSPENFMRKFSYLFEIDDLTNTWITIWLSIISIFVSLITALIAILISIKQDDLVKFEFETSLIPMLESDGFKSWYIPPNEINIYEHINSRTPKPNEPYKNLGGVFVLDFQLKNELNLNIKYEIESVKIYDGLHSIEEIEKNSDKDKLIGTFTNNDQCIFLDIKQRKGAFVLEHQIYIKDRAQFNEAFNRFLINLETPRYQQNQSMYSLLFNIDLKSLSHKYQVNKKLILLINLWNESVVQDDRTLENTFTVNSVEHKFVL